MDLRGFVDDALGLQRAAHDLLWWQAAARALVMFVVAIVILRLGSRRFMGRSTPLDALLALVLGSVLAAGIYGAAGFVQSLSAAVTLVLLHWILTALVVRWHGLGRVVKGDPRPLVRDGQPLPREMTAAHVTVGDLAEAARREGARDERDIQAAHLERNGDISVAKKD
jgi:uncharacterized membrane protein YcaP (DUF421 family)